MLREHCETVGRDYNSIIKSANMQNIFLLEPGEVARADAITEPYRFGQPLAEWRKTQLCRHRPGVAGGLRARSWKPAPIT